jgi:DNA-binding NarL/FixJ family response regulator
VKKHLQHIFEKLGVENRTTAASFYWEPPDVKEV